MRLLLVLLSVVITGCGAGQVIQAGSNTYTVTSSGAGFSTDGVKADVYRAANEFCAQKNLMMVETAIKTQNGALGRNPPSADLQFRCLAQGDPEIERRASGVQAVVIGAVPVSDNGSGTGAGRDSYAKLKQLKELLDSGVLTQKEFDEQKARELAR